MKIFTGQVVDTKMTKTAMVSVARVVVHPLYKKRFTRDRRYPVHDEMNVKVGDTVKFAASKPYSKTKKWKILEIVSTKGGKSQITNPKSQTSSKNKNSKSKTERRQKTSA